MTLQSKADFSELLVPLVLTDAAMQRIFGRVPPTPPVIELSYYEVLSDIATGS